MLHVEFQHPNNGSSAHKQLSTDSYQESYSVLSYFNLLLVTLVPLVLFTVIRHSGQITIRIRNDGAFLELEWGIWTPKIYGVVNLKNLSLNNGKHLILFLEIGFWICAMDYAVFCFA
jgi:hypothetical protein